MERSERVFEDVEVVGFYGGGAARVVMHDGVIAVVSPKLAKTFDLKEGQRRRVRVKPAEASSNPDVMPKDAEYYTVWVSPKVLTPSDWNPGNLSDVRKLVGFDPSEYAYADEEALALVEAVFRHAVEHAVLPGVAKALQMALAELRFQLQADWDAED